MLGTGPAWWAGLQLLVEQDIQCASSFQYARTAAMVMEVATIVLVVPCVAYVSCAAQSVSVQL